MCRLFGINAGEKRVHVDYWLVDAPDSILVESHRNPDGTGVGWFADDDTPHVDKQPRSAFTDSAFTKEAKSVDARTLITHIRAATAGHDALENTHPFVFDGRIMAHNGGFGDLPAVEAQIGDYLGQVQGQTDSERYAALIAKKTADNGGDVSAGIIAAAAWLADNVPMYSLNCLVAAPGHLWALRYPDQRALHIARRRLDPATGLVASSALASHTVHASQPTEVVIIASERIDEQQDWRMLDPGELIHVGPDLSFTSTLAIERPPAHLHLLDEADPNVDTF
ncbi:MAG: class II glutamine amidotransferase [Candidatus Nanopelagicales bacterium]|jgi:predicted glutamine amidotransferase